MKAPARKPLPLSRRIGRVSLTGSLQRKLILQFLAVAAVVAVALFFAVRVTADRAAGAAQDAVLAAATLALSEGLRSEEDGLDLDLPPTVLSMLAAMGDDRVFYRVDIGAGTVTGYADLPMPGRPPVGATPVFYEAVYRGFELRLAAVSRTLLVDGLQTEVFIALGQTRFGQSAIAGPIARRAALLGIGFFLLAVPLSLLAARSILGPVGRVAETVERRGPRDLRPVSQSVPRELGPLIGALNGFILRLRGALTRTETFIAEAAHHILTPLSAVRAEAEIALHQSHEDTTRAHLRNVIRSVEESSRSAGQLLDHAAVMYRSDRDERTIFDLHALVAGLVATVRPTADLREITVSATLPEGPLRVTGDRLLIEAALRNLLDNAIKYSPPDSEVDVELSTSGGGAQVKVMDRGRGLGGATLADLSVRFRRGRNVSDIVGSGLGLTIVTEVAEASGGHFNLFEREGGGACAEFSLPLH
jgi:two-component system sensor histidine kinase TctE